eukprot:2632009-Rhodomonas_salina.2
MMLRLEGVDSFRVESHPSRRLRDRPLKAKRGSRDTSGVGVVWMLVVSGGLGVWQGTDPSYGRSQLSEHYSYGHRRSNTKCQLSHSIVRKTDAAAATSALYCQAIETAAYHPTKTIQPRILGRKRDCAIFLATRSRLVTFKMS